MRSLPILLALTPLSALAATLDVGPAGTYATIGEAIAAANSGDVIEVEAGDYPETLTIDNLSIDIVALQGPGSTSISGAAATNMVDILNDSRVSITGFEFVGNSPRAIQTANSSLILTDVVATGFDISGQVEDGAAVSCNFGSLEINDSLFDSNTGEDGGHFRLESCDAIITNTSFLGGVATDDGGVARVDASDLVLIDVWIEGNSAGDTGGAFSFQDSGSLDISGTTFAGNTGNGLGGAIQVGQNPYGTSSVDVLIADSSFSQNSGSLGGALYHRGTGDLTLRDNLFDGNSAADSNGGALRFFPDGVLAGVIEGNVFIGNTASDIGGAIAASATGGGGNSTLELTGNDFRGNDATRGGGISVDTLATVVAVGNQFCGNNGDNSGGGARVTNAGGVRVVFTNNVFVENTSGGVGGGLATFNTQAVFGPNYQFVNNTFAGNDGVEGGNIYTDNAAADFVNNIILGAVGGGGFFSTNGSPGVLDYNLWFDNAPDDVAGTLVVGDLGANDVFADPDFVNYSADGVCGNDVLTLSPGSPAIDAGDPSIQDADGSNSDIGAFGGPNVPPGATEDLDGDGWPGAADCDDDDNTVNPGEPEVCDGVDNNCDGLVDDGTATGASDWYPDVDGDGFGDDGALFAACNAPPNYIAAGGDCDDRDANTNPTATEICDQEDNDCDGTVDDGLTQTYYDDDDADGFGDPGATTDTCAGAPAGTVTNGSDCDDGDATVNPSAAEVCDGQDNNCDNAVDEGLVTPWYRDVDSDGYGTVDNTTEDCVQPSGFVPEAGDCDDEDVKVNPGASDLSANGVDEDCDGKDGKKSAGEELAVISGCGCSTGSSPAGVSWLALLGLATLLRRREPTR